MKKQKQGFERMTRKERREHGRKGAAKRWANVRVKKEGPEPFMR